MKPLSKNVLLLLTILACVAVSPMAAYAQAQQASGSELADKDRGIALYEQGDTKAAIKVLRAAVKQNDDDADAWFYLGSALIRNEDVGDARKALKKAIELRPEHAPSHIGLAYSLFISNKLWDALGEVRQAIALDARNAEAHYVMGLIVARNGELEKALTEAETASQLDPNYAPPFLLKSRVILELHARETSYSAVYGGKPYVPLSPEERQVQRKARSKRFIDARDSLEKYLQLSPNTSGLEMSREQLASLRAYTVEDDKVDLDSTKRLESDTDKNIVIISKPSPTYPEEDRNYGISGTVSLFLTLSSDGAINNVLVVQTPTDRLAAAAIKVAKQIRFSPAIRNGQPVSKFMRIEYNFNVH